MLFFASDDLLSTGVIILFLLPKTVYTKVVRFSYYQGRSCGRPPRALGNEEDGMASAFPKGKQNEKIFLRLYLTSGRYIELWKI
jgi:hypothetical protein